jgi:hypothetical protein
MQTLLSGEQIEAFYHDEFVEDQVRDFVALVPAVRQRVVTDVGGGCGFFARRLMQVAGHRVRVIDVDPQSIETCRSASIEAELGDALQPPIRGDEQTACFNLILHHLVGSSEEITRGLQTAALGTWRPYAQEVFVNEYIYESYVRNFSGWLIFQITKSKILSALGRIVAMLVPSLKANTFGVGVRFRAHDEWLRLFADAGYDVKSTACGKDEPVSAPRRMLFIKRIRRDSFLLVPRKA